MEKKKLFISREDLENIINSAKEDKVLKSVIEVVCNVASKVAKYIDNFEGIMTDYDGDTACISISVDNFTDMELFAIEDYTSDVIDYCNYHEPQYELINIEVLDDVVILKVKV